MCPSRCLCDVLCDTRCVNWPFGGWAFNELFYSGNTTEPENGTQFRSLYSLWLVYLLAVHQKQNQCIQKEVTFINGFRNICHNSLNTHENKPFSVTYRSLIVCPNIYEPVYMVIHFRIYCSTYIPQHVCSRLWRCDNTEQSKSTKQQVSFARCLDKSIRLAHAMTLVIGYTS